MMQRHHTAGQLLAAATMTTTTSAATTTMATGLLAAAGTAGTGMMTTTPAAAGGGYKMSTGTVAAGGVASSSSKEATVIVEDVRTVNGVKQVIKRFVKGRLLGKGGFANCYKYTGLDGRYKDRVFAGKVVKKDSLKKKSAKEKLRAEIAIHKSLANKNVVKFESYFEDSECVHIVLELCPHQSLMELMRRRRRLTEQEVQYYALQLIEGVLYLHSRNVIHRDLKLGNLLLDEDLNIKIGDFGLAAQLTNASERKTTVCGTPNYLAPEILAGSKAGGHSFEVDVWSIGVILFTMLTGTPPFETTNVKETYRLISSNRWAFPADIPVSAPARDLVAAILRKEPAERPTLEGILRHPFFTGPGVMIPTRLPLSCLTEVPVLRSDLMASGASIVANIMATAPAAALIPPLPSPAVPLAVPAPPSSAAPHSHHMTTGLVPAPSTFAPSIPAAAPVLPPSAPSSLTREPLATIRENHHAQHRPSSTKPSTTSSSSSTVPHVHHAPPVLPAPSTSAAVTTPAPIAAALPPVVSPPPAPVATRTASPADVAAALVSPPPAVSRTPSATSVSPAEVVAGSRGTPVESSPPAVTARPATAASAPGGGHGHADTLQELYDVLSLGATGPAAAASTAVTCDDLLVMSHPEPWVVSWVDYTSKYGLGYLLSNAAVGVYFNDSTKIVLHPDGETFEYIARSASAEPPKRHTLTTHPADLQKKVTLLKHFRNYLLEQRELLPTAPAGASAAPSSVYVKKWIRTKHAVLFRLSNHQVQVNFADKTSLVLSSKAHLVTYEDKLHVRTTHKLASIFAQHRPDIIKRLEYTKDILHQLVKH